MKMGRSTKKFAKTEVYLYNESTATWDLLDGVRGCLLVYDRFISDRAFGQKKRLFETPIAQKLPMDPDVRTVIKVGDGHAIFLIESENEDIQNSNAFSNIYSLRQLSWPAVISKKSGQKWASGAPKNDALIEIDRTWVDYDRYTANKSTESPGVNYTVETMIFPRGTKIDTDCQVSVDGMEFEINEVATLLNSLYCRVQKIGVKGP